MRSRKGPIALIVTGVLLALGPLWGLLGSVVGMLGVFSTMSQSGPAKPEQLASGNPPKLVYEVGASDTPGVLVVEFRFGRGLEYLATSPVETMLAELAEHVNFLRRLIRTVRQLSRNYANEPLLRHVVNELEK